MNRLFLATLVLTACGDDSGAPAQPDGAMPDAVMPDAAAGCGAGIAPAAGLVITESGAQQGSASANGWAWKGIPYAAPPVGSLRWRPPQTPSCADGVRDASEFGSLCLQLDQNNQPTGSEDCLTLNIWAPTNASALPVMFFIHGGGNAEGSSSFPVYDGTALAGHGVVVVTINYRLAQMGFLAFDALQNENTQHVAGNYGALDQIAALQWVHRNIAAFGGDPARVMIFGESAGAVDVCVLVTSPLTPGLFTKALMESGGCFQKTLADALTAGRNVVQMAGCDSASDVAACMRALPANTVLQTLPATVNGLVTRPYQPNVDGYVLVQSPYVALLAGTYNHVPFIVGSNADETARMVPNVTTDAQYMATLQSLYGSNASAIYQHYPAASYSSPKAALIQATTDGRFVCPSRLIARAAATGQQDQPVHRYFFTHGLDHGVAQPSGAFHGLELFFVFGTASSTGYVPSAAEVQLATDMETAWSNFAKNADPGWPTYDAQLDRTEILDEPFATQNGIRSSLCDFWETLTP
jgi:para-nitrobenzyl esterase